MGAATLLIIRHYLFSSSLPLTLNTFPFYFHLPYLSYTSLFSSFFPNWLYFYYSLVSKFLFPSFYISYHINIFLRFIYLYLQIHFSSQQFLTVLASSSSSSSNLTLKLSTLIIYSRHIIKQNHLNWYHRLFPNGSFSTITVVQLFFVFEYKKKETISICWFKTYRIQR